VKNSDATYKKLIEIQNYGTSGDTMNVMFGPCCAFRVIETASTLVKTPRPFPTVQSNRITSIKK